MNFGQKIKDAREDLDLTQADMARLIPMNQSNYSKIERDTQEPSLEQLKQICLILKLDPRYLLGLKDEEYIDRNDMKMLSEIKSFVKKYSNK